MVARAHASVVVPAFGHRSMIHLPLNFSAIADGDVHESAAPVARGPAFGHLSRPMAAQATLLHDPRLEMKGFFVHVEGAVPVGPVSASQIARGLRAGKIPSEATVQWEGEVFWRDIFDEPAVIAALKAL